MRTVIPGDNDKQCYLCGVWGRLEVHHCLHGSRRKLCDEDRLTVHICPVCHRLLHDKGFNDRYLEQVAEETWLDTHPGATVEDFIKRYGKSYL